MTFFLWGKLHFDTYNLFDNPQNTISFFIFLILGQGFERFLITALVQILTAKTMFFQVIKKN
jgi:hypothetical protein